MIKDNSVQVLYCMCITFLSTVYFVVVLCELQKYVLILNLITRVFPTFVIFVLNLYS